MNVGLPLLFVPIISICGVHVYICGYFLSQFEFPKINVKVCNSVTPPTPPIDFPIPLSCTIDVHYKQDFLIKWDIFTYMYHYLFEFNISLYIYVWFEKVLPLLLQMNAKL